MTQDERNELLRWADHVDVLVRFCAVHMPANRVDQYSAGSAAYWAMVWKISGDDVKAAELAKRVPATVVQPPLPPDWFGSKSA